MLHLFTFDRIKNRLFWAFVWLFILTWFVVLPRFVYAQNDDILSGNDIISENVINSGDSILSGDDISSESENVGIIYAVCNDPAWCESYHPATWRSYGEWANPEPSSCKIYCHSSNNWFWYKYGDALQIILIYLLIVIIVSFFVTLWFYLMYKNKNDEHPRKHAIKRSWPRWIIIFLVPWALQKIYFIWKP